MAPVETRSGMLKAFYPNGLFFLITFFGLWLSYEWVSRQMQVDQDFALTKQLVLFKNPQDKELRNLLVEEIRRRISYHLYAGETAKLEALLGARYSVRKFNLRQGGSGESERTNWVETEKGQIGRAHV